MTVKSRFFQIFHFKKVLSATIGSLIKKRDFEGFKAMSIALGSTIGIGNIVGVTAAICVGGPGAVFWMLLTGVLGMMTKFAEIYICANDTLQNGRTSGGPMYVLRQKGEGILKKAGGVFAVATVLASLFAGNISQSKAIFEFSKLGFSINPLIVSVAVVPLLAFIVFGKDKLYKNFSAVFVPLMAVIYIIAVAVIIIKNIANVPAAVFSIFTSAFGLKEVAGGVGGSIIAVTVKTGIMKGLFTNEAGMGSSPIAHCSANELDPYSQGCWGIVEVFTDTVVVCMLTALAVLSSPVYQSLNTTEPFALICRVFEECFGTFGIKALSFSAVCFAFASVIGWSFYGIKALEFLSENKTVKKMYLVLFIVLVPISSFVNGDAMWTLTDLFNSLMLIPNAILLLCCGGEVADILRKGNRKNDLQLVSQKMRCKENRK